MMCNGNGPDGPSAAPGDVLPDGTIMAQGVGGHANYPVGRGVLWVTLEQATAAEPHGWTRVPHSETADGLVQVAR